MKNPDFSIGVDSIEAVEIEKSVLVFLSSPFAISGISGLKFGSFLRIYLFSLFFMVRCVGHFEAIF